MMNERVLGAALVAAMICNGGTSLAQKKRDMAAIAETLVTSGVAVKEGDVVSVSGGAADAELLEELQLAIGKRGGHALVLFEPSNRIYKRLWSDIPAKYDSQVP